jgi:MFS family permease
MNGFVPLVTDCSKSEVMKVNTLLLVVDMILLPCFGWLATRFGKERVMLMGAACSTFAAIPLFASLDHATVGMVIGVRVAMIFFGVAFAAPYHAWALEQVPKEARYTVLSLGSALGSQLIGMPTAAISLWLYQTTGCTFAPGLYLILTGFMAGYMVYWSISSPERFNLIK